MLVNIDGVQVLTAQQLQDLLATKKPGATTHITYLRPPSTETKTATVTLGELPAG